MADIKAKFTPQNFRKLINKLTITTPQKIGKPKVAKLYMRSRIKDVAYIHFPRSMAGVFASHNLFKYTIKLPPKCVIPNTFTGQLDNNQTVIVDYLMKSFYSRTLIAVGRGSTVLQLTAGYGKTFIGIGLIARLCTRTLVIVPANSDLAQQWYLCCEQFLTGSSVLYNNKKNVICDTTIVMITTAIKKPPEWFKQFGFIIFDEIHMFCSPVWSVIFWRTNAKCVLGLTATPDDRKDQFDEVFKRHVGAVTYADNIPYFQPNEIAFTGIVDVVNYDGPPEYTVHHTNEATGKLDAGKLVKQLNDDPDRNELIVSEVIRLYNLHTDEDEIAEGNSNPDKPLSIYVFCSYRSHVAVLKEMLNDAELDVDAPELAGDAVCAAPTAVKIMMGSMKREDIEAAKKARITLTTFKFSGTGISVVEKTAILFASPLKSNFKQIVARILRKGSDYDVVRRITDIVDGQTALRFQYRERAKSYKLYNFDITFRDAE